MSDHGADGYVEEGSRVRFRCKAHANPPQMSYAWYVGGRRVADAPEASTELVLDHVDRRLHNHVVRCEVTNPIGKTDESAILNVACKLRLIYITSIVIKLIEIIATVSLITLFYY